MVIGRSEAQCEFIFVVMLCTFEYLSISDTSKWIQPTLANLAFVT